MLAVSIWISHLADAESNEIDESDVVFYKMMALSQILLPGLLWGLAFHWLMTKETGASACVWLLVSPVCLAMIGVSVVAGARERWQVANGLGALGVLGGHFLGYSHFGQAVTAFASEVGTSLPVVMRSSLGVSIMAIAAVCIMQSRVRATSTDLRRSSINDFQPFSKDKKARDTVEDRPIELQDILNVLTWTFGLALCVATTKDAYARAILVSGSIAVVFPMTFSPPPTRTTWTLSYGTYVRWLFVLHMVVVVLCSSYDIS